MLKFGDIEIEKNRSYHHKSIICTGLQFLLS